MAPLAQSAQFKYSLLTRWFVIYLSFFFSFFGVEDLSFFLNLYMKVVLNESPFSLLALGKNYYPHWFFWV